MSRRCLAGLAAGLAIACAPAVHQETPPSADLVILHANVVDVRTGRVLRDRHVLVDGGRITRVSVAFRNREPAARMRIDATGTYLIPGLWDMHAHLRANGAPVWITTDWLMPLLVAHGVTGVRDMSSDCDRPAQGPVCLAQMRAWSAQVEAGTLVGPRLVALSSWPIDPPWDYRVTEQQAGEVVAKLRQDGIEHLKLYDRLSPEAFGWVMQAAKAQGLDAWGHVPLRVSAVDASNAGMRSIEHARDFIYDCFPGSADFRRSVRSSTVPVSQLRAMLDEHDPMRCREVFRTLARNGTAYVPTHLTRRMEAYADDSAYRHDPRSRFVPPAIMGQWIADADRTVARDTSVAGRRTFMDFYRKGLELTGAAHRAGVRVLVGTDGGDSFVFPGSSVHDELAELVAAGLSPAEALRAATLGGAEFLRRAGDHGVVEVGRRADLVLLAGNPLDNIDHVRRIRAVILGGRALERAALDSLLRHAEDAAKQPLKLQGR